ncbi:hypothetical protein [Maribacter hydrothermalis]|nr:hypothetical protein [Maribacter hydrothermalis]
MRKCSLMFVLFVIFLAIAANIMKEDESSGEILTVAIDVQEPNRQRP